MNIDDMMADLRVGYVADLPNKISVINSALNEQKNEEVRDGFHKLKGTGKTYGLPEVTTLCAVMEKLCIEKPEQIKEFTPKGLSVLSKIHKARAQEKPHPLDSDSEFKDLEILSQS